MQETHNSLHYVADHVWRLRFGGVVVLRSKESVSAVLQVDQEVDVRVKDIRTDGKVSLTMRLRRKGLGGH